MGILSFSPPDLCRKFFKVKNMEVITIESQAFKELSANVNMIAKYVLSLTANKEEASNEGWVDNYEVCTFLKISQKTLQRLRSANLINFTRIGGKNFYKISEIKRLMDEKMIRRTDEHLQELIKNHKLYDEQRRNSKTNQ